MRRSRWRPRRSLLAATALAVTSVLVAACSSSVAGLPEITGGQSAPSTGAASGTESGSSSSSTALGSITAPATLPGSGGSTQGSPSTSDSVLGSTPVSGGGSTSSTGPIPTGLTKYYTQTLSWGPCESYATNSDDAGYYSSRSLSCARVTLPMDYSQPNGPTITVGLLKKAATGSKIGSVVFDPGGPGASGMSIVAQIADYDVDPTLNQHFDLVGFDPRGVGSSTPTIRCQTNAQFDADRAANWPGYMPTSTPAEVTAANDKTKQYVQGCITLTSDNGKVNGKQFLANVGTVDVAKDLDVIRAVLGDRKLTYVGWSYGTSIGTQYAEQFPTNVRALILDGAINPDEDSATDSYNQTVSFQKAFQTYADSCAQQPNCPLGTDGAKASAAFQALARPLYTKPLKLSDGRVLSFSDAVTGVSEAMYSDSEWSDLTKALQQLADGDGSGLMDLADEYYERSSDGQYSNLTDAFNAIRCMDNKAITDPTTVTELNAKLTKASPFADDGQPAAAVFDICAYWPVPPTLTPHVPKVTGLPKVLVISTTGDPATPYQDGVDLAKDLGAALLTVQGTRHTAYMLSGITCADQIGNNYLINLTLPSANQQCS